ncbi:MAG: VanZ family protein [Clostridia bacterium]|nr:VanZ family protein [Clostridia bacterium]
MSALYQWVYYMNLPLLILLGVGLLAVWTALSLALPRRAWRWVCAALVPLCLYLVYAGTLRGRGVGEYENYFIPFQVVVLHGLSAQYIREFVLNCVLFAPLGATLSFALPRWWLCLPSAAVISLAVEILQASLRVGYFQTDDLLCNLLGTLVGALPYLIHSALAKRRGK